jgi:hypothetical protein
VAWESRKERKYLYRTVTVGGRSSKHYHGAGLEAEMIEAQWALARAETKDRQEQAERIRKAVVLTEKLCEASHLWSTATLLVSGYHKIHRHQWRSWYEGRRILGLSD